MLISVLGTHVRVSTGFRPPFGALLGWTESNHYYVYMFDLILTCESYFCGSCAIGSRR